MNETTNMLIETTAWLSQNAVNLLIQSSVLILIGLLAARCLRRHGSAIQSAIYRATLVAVVVCPLAAIALNQIGFDGWTIQLPSATRIVLVPEPSEPRLVNQAALPVPQVNVDDAAPDRTPLESTLPLTNDQPVESDGSLSLPPASAVSPEFADAPVTVAIEGRLIERTFINSGWMTAYSIAGFIWLLGTLLLLVRLSFAYRKLAGVRRRSPSATVSDQTLCDQLAERINVRTPDVRRNSLLSSPCLTGIASPAILLPSEIQEQVPLQKAFAHELAHLRRHDTLWNLLQRIALAFFFYQPLMWRLVYRLETTAEEVCDDYVVRHCMDRKGYAEQLVELAESNLLAPNMAGIGMFKNSKSLLGHRVVRILDTTRKLTTQISLPIIVCIVALTMVCATLGGFLGNGKSPLSMFHSPDETTSESSEQEEIDALIRLAGRILDSQGSPVSGARVSVFPAGSHLFGNRNPAAYTTTASQRDGSFEIEFSQNRLIPFGGAGRASNFCLVAIADGFGINWMDAEQLKDQLTNKPGSKDQVYAAVDLRLTNDNVKTKLRLIDPEGNPVTNATARITRLTRFPNEDMTSYYEQYANNDGPTITQGPPSTEAIRFHGLAKCQTDSKGILEIIGVGDNRIAKLEITGPDMAIRTLSVATAAAADTVSVTYGGMYRTTLTTHGPESTITCEPTQPIVGQVFDSETRQPLAGVKIISSKFAGTNLGGINILQTESDEQGRFRLTGMPKGPGNTIVAVPGDDHPYFMTRFEVPAASGLDAAQLDVPLQRGIFIRGTATDAKTGQPIVGTLNYLPFLSNTAAAASHVYESGQFMEIQNRYRTKSDGTFQLVGLPGRAVVGINVAEGFYPSGMGWDDIDKREKSTENDGEIKTFNRPVTPSRLWPTAMQQVDIATGQTEHVIEFKLDPGLSIPLRITDDEGRPLVGVAASRLRSRHEYQYVTTQSSVNATGFAANEKRLVKFQHYERNLSLVVELDASILDSAGQLDDPVQIRLLPSSVITGKLVDVYRDAIVNGQVRCDVGGGGNFGMMMNTAIRNDGSFRIEHIPSGTHYAVFASTAGNFYTVCERLVVQAGENIDLGTINVDEKTRPEPTRTKQATTETVSEQDSTDSHVKFSGLIVDLHGIAVADAKISYRDFEATSQSDGTFTIEIPSGIIETIPTGKPYVTIEKRGYGRSFARLTVDDKQELTLINDDHPIEGQLIDTEGKPVSGATIVVERMQDFGNGVLDRCLNNATIDGVVKDLPQGVGIYWEEENRVTSGENGRFSIRRIGSGRIAYLKITGPKVAIRKALVATSDLGNVKYDDPQYNQLSDGIIHSRNPILTCEPSQPIEGTVVDRDSKRPLAGFTVTSYGFLNDGPSKLVGQTDLKTITDENGRFRLTGMPKGKGNSIMVSAPTSGEGALPYITQIADVPDAPGIDAIQMEVPVQRGVWISGQVVNKESGQPIVNAPIQYMPFDDNPTGLTLDRFRQPLMKDFYGSPTDEEGNYRFVGIPGPAAVAVWVVNDPGYPVGQGWDEIPEERKSGGTLNSTFFRGIDTRACAIAAIDAAEDGVQQDFQLTKGAPVRVRTVDAEGKPVSGVIVSFIPALVGKATVTESAEFDVDGFLPGQNRMLFLRSPEKKVGTYATISLDQDAPVVVTLHAYGKMTAKLIDENGKPAVGAGLAIHKLTENGAPLTGAVPYSRNSASADGTYSRELLPGKYSVNVRSFNGSPGYRQIEVKSGETFDLGTIDVTKPFGEVLMMSQPGPVILPSDKNSDDEQAASDEDSSQDVVSDTEPQATPAEDPQEEKDKKPDDKANSGATVIGIVVDRDTKEPLQGILVSAPGTRSASNSLEDLSRTVQTTTHKDGRFKLTGVLSSKYSSPFISFSSPNDDPQTTPFVSQRHWAKKRTESGSWNVDVEMQRGVWISGKVIDRETREPISQIPLSRNYRYRVNETTGQLEREPEQFRTNARSGKNGEFRFVGLPGPLAIGLYNGANQPQYLPNQGWGEVPDRPDIKDGDLFREMSERLSAISVKYVNIAPAGTSDISIELTRGELVHIKTIDAEGKPVDKVSVIHLPFQNRIITDSAEFTAGHPPGEKRALILTNKRGCAIVEIGPDTKQPLVVTLGPSAKIKGTTVNEYGQPLVWNRLDAELKLENGQIYNAASTVTSGNGEFSHSIPPGKFEYSFKNYLRFSGYKTINVAPGETLDLGTIVVPEKNDADARMIHHQSNRTGKEESREQAEAETDITGQIVDLEGRPVIGATIFATYMSPLGKELADQWLAKLAETRNYGEARQLRRQSKQSGKSLKIQIESDNNGNFTIPGLPLDALVSVRVEHPQIATQLFEVLNRTMAVVDADPQYKVHGNRPLLVTQPGRPIVGSVVDSKTGKAIADAIVYCSKMGVRDSVYWSSPAPRTKTDKNGEFELLGVPKSDGTELFVYPPLDQPYLIKQIRRIPDTVGLAPAELAIKLHRGIWITGKVVDNQTAQGVKGEIVYLPMKDNPHLKTVSGFQMTNSLDRYNYFGHFNTDDQGNYRIVGLPGRAVLGARVPSQEYRSATGYEKLLDEFGSDYSEERIKQALIFGTDLRGQRFIDTHFSFFVWSWVSGSSYVGIAPVEGVDSFEQNILMDAGRDVTVKVVDTDSNLVDRFEISRFDGYYGKKEFTHGIGVLQKMGTDEIRKVWVRAIDRPLGAIVSVNGAPKTLPTIVLLPYATVRGRLVDQEGKPLLNYSVDASHRDPATTDANGEFEIAGMFADQKFKLEISAPGEDEYRLYLHEHPAKAGQTIELGEINVDEMKDIFISGMAG